MRLGGYIKALRKEAGSHDKLAKELGTSRQRVIDWEHGGYPRDYVDQLIERGVPPDVIEQARPTSSRRAALADEVARLGRAVRDLEIHTSALHERVSENEELLHSLREASGNGAQVRPSKVEES